MSHNGGKGASAGPVAEPVAIGVPMSKFVKYTLNSTPDLVLVSQARSLAAEKFRRLRTLLTHMDPPPRAVVVTSASPGDGKSMVSINLALAFAAEGDGRVVLVDCDLRRPTVGSWVLPKPGHGFSDVVAEKAGLGQAILRIEDTALDILPAGTLPQDPVEVLGSSAARTVVEELRERYRMVILDTPPIVPFTDADVVGRYADGVLLVARAGATLLPSFQQAVAAVSSTRILGVVLNDVARSLADWNRYNDYAYHDYYAEDRRK